MNDCYRNLLSGLMGDDGLDQNQHDALVRYGALVGCKILLQSKMIDKATMKSVIMGTWTPEW